MQRRLVSFLITALTLAPPSQVVTTTRRVAIYRFTHPHTKDGGLLIDAGYCLSYPNRQEDGAVAASVSSRS